MKKRTKTTDSVLKDIFDPLIQTAETASHPLSDFSREAKHAAQAPSGNRLEPWIEEVPMTPSETQTVSEEFDAKLEEVKQESLLFREKDAVSGAEPAVLEPSEILEVQAAEEIPALEAEPALSEIQMDIPAHASAATQVLPAKVPAETKKSPQLHHLFVKVSVIAVFAGLSCLLGYFLYMQNHEIEQRKTAAKTPVGVQTAVSAVPQANPVSYWLSSVPHQGVTFKNFSAKNKKLMIKGAVSNQQDLVRFLNSLNRSSYFKNAKITSMQELKTSFWQKNYLFQLYADIQFSK